MYPMETNSLNLYLREREEQRQSADLKLGNERESDIFRSPDRWRQSANSEMSALVLIPTREIRISNSQSSTK